MEVNGLDEDQILTSWCHSLYSKRLKNMKEVHLQCICRSFATSVIEFMLYCVYIVLHSTVYIEAPNTTDSVNYTSVICWMYLEDLFKSENTCAIMQNKKRPCFTWYAPEWLTLRGQAGKTWFAHPVERAVTEVWYLYLGVHPGVLYIRPALSTSRERQLGHIWKNLLKLTFYGDF